MIDIKDWIQQAAATLGSGEVVKDDHLSFLEAMNALQIMDPAMDWGANFSPKGKFDPTATLSPEQLCWIMDEMNAREMAWYAGATMAQSVHTSLHYHNVHELRPKQGLLPDSPEKVAADASCLALRAFVVSYAKGHELAHNTLLNARTSIRDGEDIWLDQYGVPIETDEDIHSVMAYIDGAVDWLDSIPGRTSEDWWWQVIQRLRFKRAWMALMYAQFYLRPFSRNDLRLPSREEIRFSTAAVPWAFDAVTPFLRQNMPSPVPTVPTHEETWCVVRTALNDMLDHDDLSKVPFSHFEQYLHNSKDKALSVIRAQYVLALPYEARNPRVLDAWLTRVAGLAPGTLQRFEATISTGQDKREFDIWRDIVSEAILEQLSCSFLNPGRQRRSMEHLAATWADQTATAQRIFSGGVREEYRRIAGALCARALDCQLAAALLAFKQQLVGDAEQLAAWWWVLRVSSARVGLQGLNVTWETTWADAWSAVASAMVLLYTAVPASKDTPSLPHFVLRHKIELRSVNILVTPSVVDWERAKDALERRHKDTPNATMSLARSWLVAARRFFDDLTAETEGRVVVKAELAALDALIAAVGGPSSPVDNTEGDTKQTNGSARPAGVTLSELSWAKRSCDDTEGCLPTLARKAGDVRG